MAAADKELVGKKLKGEGIELDVSEKFYKGKAVSKKELKQMLREFDNINLIGNKVVGIALEENLASKEQVTEIQGVKHLQIMVL